MKIVAPLSDARSYERLAACGADEFYCGFVPFSWLRRYGNVLPVNRRPYLLDFNITTFPAMRMLARLVERTGKPVKVAFNALSYVPEQMPRLLDLFRRLMDLGFDTFIVADVALLVELRSRGVPCRIHLSGETSEMNPWSIRFFDGFGIARYVFTRKNGLEEMRSCIRASSGPGTEFEAFVLNERCSFSGAACHTLHCDELRNFCSIPCRLAALGPAGEAAANPGGHDAGAGRRPDRAGRRKRREPASGGGGPGLTGCGLCRVHALGGIGVTHGKVVGRGRDVRALEEDIRCLRACIGLAAVHGEESPSVIRRRFFPGGCPERTCYYP